MSLGDALLLDLARLNVWLALRNDGVAGSGTESEPYDGSTADGNLLMDVRNFVGSPATFPPPFASPPYLDGAFTAGDSVSCVYAATGDGTGSVDSLSGRALTFGFTMLFELSQSLNLIWFCCCVRRELSWQLSAGGEKGTEPSLC